MSQLTNVVDTSVSTTPLKQKQKLSGAQIREVRSLCAKGCSQIDVARRFGLAPSYVSQIIKGLRRKNGI